MSGDLSGLYQKIQQTPAMAVDIPREAGEGRIVCLDTGAFSVSSWKMKFSRDTHVEGEVSADLRLLFCLANDVEWIADEKTLHLGHNEACFCLTDGAAESMCYQRGLPFSFVSVAMPKALFEGTMDRYASGSAQVMDFLPGKHFAIPPDVHRNLQQIGSLESVHSGFEMMRLDARLLETLALCLQAAMGESHPRSPLHQDDMNAICAIGKRIEEHPADISDIGTLARECCMSVSKLTRSFRQVYGVSLHAYVREARLSEGARLLRQGGMRIGEIAERVGYTKPDRFSADFRKRFGLLPREFR